MTQPKKS